MIYPKNRSKQTCDYWLITRNQQTLCNEPNIFQQRAITNQRAGNYKTAGNYMQNNTVNGAMSITINRVIMVVIDLDIQ